MEAYTLWTDDLSLEEDLAQRVGGKAVGLVALATAGLPVHHGFVVTTAAYRRFVTANTLDEVIANALAQDLRAMRWEAVWDLSLDLRNRFMRAPLPEDVATALRRALDHAGTRFTELYPLALRSSSTAEDAAGGSFAGLHDSFLNVRDADDFLATLPALFASLWSDRALLYRRELGLNQESSAMAGLVHPMLEGRAAGVCFTRNPMGDASAPQGLVIEAHAGAGEALVSGEVEPERWVLDREDFALLDHAAPASDASPPLSEDERRRLARLCLTGEEALGRPADIEWLLRDDFIMLQARPITTLGDASKTTAGNGDEDPRAPWERKDRRPWELSLRRGFTQLKRLRATVEEELMPAMEDAAAELVELHPADLDDQELAEEIDHRRAAFEHWKTRYYEECVPLAHAVRLFGQIYNDRVQPEDPFAFRDLLAGQQLEGVRRNNALHALAEHLRENPTARERAAAGERPAADMDFTRELDDFMDDFGALTCHEAWCEEGEHALLQLLARMAASDRVTRPSRSLSRESLESRYFSAFSEEEQPFAHELLDLARAAFRLRDDDNFALGRVEAALLDAVSEGRRRLRNHADAHRTTSSAIIENKKTQSGDSFTIRDTRASSEGAMAFRHAADMLDAKRNTQRALALLTPEDVAAVLRGRAALRERLETRRREARARNGMSTAGGDVVHGQPASAGVAEGPARVVRRRGDLFDLREGEVLVCDSVDPAMTFVAPLAAAIVERRGGMLVHGAIIAREYGVPCVTGVPDAVTRFTNGDILRVDGQSGEVRRLSRSSNPQESP